MAPEMASGNPHDYKIDVWSTGILIYELVHGFPPFTGKTDSEKTRNILLS